MKTLSYTAVILSIIFFSSTASAQTDKDIKLKDVPQAVRDYIKNTFLDVEKIDYYKETDGDTLYYLATFKYKRDEYSLLFLPNGKLHETEIEREFESLPSDVRDHINKDLCGRFSKFSIHKVQEVNPQNKFRYEILLHGKKDKHAGYFELFFDQDGNFISEEEKVMKSILNNSGF